MRTDTHVHISPIKVERRPDLQIFKGTADIERYIKANTIEAILGIYDDESYLDTLQDIPCKVYGFFWVHSPTDLPKKPPQGLKFESFVDNIRIKESQIKPALDYAEKYGIPLLIHCNQLEYDLARPSYVAELARRYKNLKFIVGHAGSYAPPLPDAQAGIERLEQLVQEAVAVCEECDNIFLESSILASPRKRKILLNALERIEDRLLLGTDYPCTVNQLIGPRFALPADYAPVIQSEEAFLLQDGITQKILKKLYNNIYRIF
jgi:predicted TIM-barrel fold metal-dependent hydrolase